ncbi:antitoxin VbhA family protein [Microbacterium oleivorans]|uniref:Antitoxin VbhA family protein n=1 Tax=Microbacterium oleivorans TaxID=273677 RepID=A0A7D5J017_9MICO|nr:antitoxin VbhA family protein [Microbacterium oleivorans]
MVRKAGRVSVSITEERAKQVEAAIHSAEIEGLTVTSATRADADSYVAGTIDSAELLERVRSRYGLS